MALLGCPQEKAKLKESNGTGESSSQLPQLKATIGIG